MTNIEFEPIYLTPENLKPGNIIRDKTTNEIYMVGNVKDTRIPTPDDVIIINLNTGEYCWFSGLNIHNKFELLPPSIIKITVKN